MDGSEAARRGGDLGGAQLQVGERQHLDLFFLGRHDPLQAGVTRLVDPGLHGDHGRQCQIDNLQPVVLELALDAHRALPELETHGGGGARPIEKTRHERADLHVVVVVGLQPAEDERKPFVLDGRDDDARDRQGIGRGERIVLDVHGPIGAGRQAGPERRRGALGADGQGHDLGGFPGVFQPQRLLERVPVVVVQAVGEIALVHPRPGAVDPERRVGVRHLLDEHEGLHSSTWKRPPRRARRLS